MIYAFLEVPEEHSDGVQDRDQDRDRVRDKRPATDAASGIGPGSGAPRRRQRPKTGGNVLNDKDYKRLCREEKLKQERAKTKKIEAQAKLLLANIGKNHALNDFNQFI